MPVSLCLICMETHRTLPRNPAVAWALKLARSHIRKRGYTLASAYWAHMEKMRAPGAVAGRKWAREISAWQRASTIAQRALISQRCSPPRGCTLGLRS